MKPSPELPDKVIDIEILRINRNIGKRCKCHKRRFIIDPNNRSVYCEECGAWVDPYEAIEEMARNYERLHNNVAALLEQARQIANYKPWLTVFKSMEKLYRKKEMLPCCPGCSEPFRFEDIKLWVNRKIAEKGADPG